MPSEVVRITVGAEVVEISVYRRGFPVVVLGEEIGRARTASEEREVLRAAGWGDPEGPLLRPGPGGMLCWWA